MQLVKSLKEIAMKDKQRNNGSEKVSSRAAIAFVAAVFVIGSSSILPPLYFGATGPSVDYEFTDVNGKNVHVHRQTGRYLKAPVRLSTES